MPRTKPKKLEKNKRYKDAPRFKVIYGYEDSFKNAFEKSVNRMAEDIIQTANKMVR